MDELLSMIDELKSNGITVDEVQLQKSIEVYRYLNQLANEFGGIVERPEYSMEGCGFEFRCDYIDPMLRKQVFVGMLKCCSELEVNAIPGNKFSMRVLVPGVFAKELQ